MGRARGIGMDMMDRDMMGMMTQGVTSDEPMDMMMRSQMGEFDENDDGALSLGEFESLHSAMLRDLMVDRFQHLDADGDGMISEAELEGAGSRMDALRGMGTDNN
jgi:Ca2+-binding EF-hand superfamily protein